MRLYLMGKPAKSRTHLRVKRSKGRVIRWVFCLGVRDPNASKYNGSSLLT